MTGWRRASAACTVALVSLLLGSAGEPGALASPCPNEQLRSGPSERLPDCRAYEQVSPVETGGLDAVSLAPVLPAQSAACEGGETCTVAYMNTDASFAGAPGNEFANAYLAARGAGGWQTTPLSPPTPQAPADSHLNVTYAFSEDLSQAVVRVPLQQLTENAPAGVYNLFLRQAHGGYTLVTANPPSQAPHAGCGACFEEEDVPVFAGASSDFSHILFEANDSLLEGAPAGEVESRHIENLYEYFGGHVNLVERLPDGAIPPFGAAPGGGLEVTDEHSGELEHAISEDGSRVLFEAQADGGAPDPAQLGDTELYDRVDGASTIEISAPGPGVESSHCETENASCEPEPAQFWAASADGSVVYFTSRAALTKDSYGGTEGSNLYRYDFETGTLSNVVADADGASGLAGASVLGVVGASEDGSYLYFVADGELAAGATSGAPNLYVWHETDGQATLRFVAALRAPDATEEKHIEKERAGLEFPYESDVADWTSRPPESQAYVTPDGTHLAFMSVEPLTGYDNRQTVVEEGHEVERADHEVFEYDAQDGQLVCASCDPHNAPPLGSAFIGATLDERASTPFHQPRALSDDGSRLFFSSPDPLVPGLSGGSDKVFEYEDGAVQLISGAEGGGSAVFLDASTSGNDVFFATREQLTSSDTGELLEVYDARVDGGLSMPASAGTCQVGACGEPAAAPSFATPLSALFTGAGSVAPGAPAVKPTRRQLLARALAKCAKLKSVRRRKVCVASAHRRYGFDTRRTRRAATAKHRSSRE
jgi:hypothetical protein